MSRTNARLWDECRLALWRARPSPDHCPRGALVIQAVPEQVRLYLADSPSEMVVVWVTFESTPSNVVQYGTAPGAYTSTRDGIEYTYDVGVTGKLPYAPPSLRPSGVRARPHSRAP